LIRRLAKHSVAWADNPRGDSRAVRTSHKVRRTNHLMLQHRKQKHINELTILGFFFFFKPLQNPSATLDSVYSIKDKPQRTQLEEGRHTHIRAP